MDGSVCVDRISAELGVERVDGEGEFSGVKRGCRPAVSRHGAFYPSFLQSLSLVLSSKKGSTDVLCIFRAELGQRRFPSNRAEVAKGGLGVLLELFGQADVVRLSGRPLALDLVRLDKRVDPEEA